MLARTCLAALVMGLIAAGAARADHTFASFSVTADGDGVAVALDGAAVPAGSYASYSLTVSWAPALGLYPAVSTEAEWELASSGVPFLVASSGPSPDARRDYAARTLTWSGPLLQTYTGGAPLEFRARQTLFGTVAGWSNINLTLHSGSVSPAVPPGAVDLLVNPGVAQVASGLLAGQVLWFRLLVPQVDAAACRTLRLETAPSALVPPGPLCADSCSSANNWACEDGGLGAWSSACALGTDCSDCGPRLPYYRHGNDSELALYNSNGFLIATNDDVDLLAPHLGGALVFGVDEGVPRPSLGDLPAGAYYLALAAYDTSFGLSHFDASSTSGISGTIVVSVALDVPALDCNTNGQPDACDIAAGVSVDADTNGIPDECPENAGPLPLCADPSGVPDLDGDGRRDFCDADRDNDGVANDVDVCPHKPIGQPGTLLGEPYGDYNHTCNVDLSDFTAFAVSCLRPPGYPAIPECAAAFDADRDADVDLADYAAFQRNFDGP